MKLYERALNVPRIKSNWIFLVNRPTKRIDGVLLNNEEEMQNHNFLLESFK